ncbi:hypothetical protein F477_02411 [Pseudomonas sp. URIL14HWK12:I3]|nr:hypothetical protein F478_01675 [Pseudomonas sp. URIL14HWK12:I2]PZW56704.1 hypothetical protein F477_02411 [Pseudomonas sp. URIL14HWK12:I3]
MLHGRTQINIAPSHELSMQYDETDRLLSDRHWHKQRDASKHGSVPLNAGCRFNRTERLLAFGAIAHTLTVSILWNLETPS